MKKMMLLALAVASAAAIMVPATASAALEPLHMNPTPAKIDILSVGPATLVGNLGTVTCEGVSGTATPEAGGTTGSLSLTFGPNCKGPGGGACTGSNPVEPAGNIATTALTYHLVTLKGKSPGVLVTPNAATGNFAHFNCTILGFPVQVTVGGNGVLGTITAPACGGKTSSATLSFKANPKGSKTQEHRQVAGVTESTIWSLSQNGEPASQEGHATLTLTDAAGKHVESELVCT